MGEFKIKDGTGKAFSAQVSDENKLATDAVIISAVNHSSAEYGEAFILASGFVSVTTTGSYNGIMYLKHIDPNTHFHIQRIRICNNGASGSMKVKLLAGPTTGTLISDANDGYACPANFASNKTAEGRLTVYAASGDGKTITDGSHITQFTNKIPGHSIQDYDGSFILHNGNSFAIVAQPSILGDICIEILGYFDKN